MYGNIGLSSAKGSGTSGYVQKSLAFIGNKYRTTSNYKEVLQKFKDNPAPEKKKANIEIIEHELKHKIEVELYILAEKLKEDKTKDMKQIEEEITKKREELYSNLKHDENIMVNIKETHQQSKMKDVQMEKMKNALNVTNEYEFGTAFDVELQEEKRQKRLLERKVEKKRREKEMKKRRKERRSRSRSRSISHDRQRHSHHKTKQSNDNKQIEEGEIKNNKPESMSRTASAYSERSHSSRSYSKSSSESREHHKKRNK